MREFTFSHANQLAAVSRAHLVALATRCRCCQSIEQRVFVHIHSLLRPVYAHKKQSASFAHTKIASRALLQLSLSPQITTLSTATAAPVIAEAQLRSAKPAPSAQPPPSSSNHHHRPRLRTHRDDHSAQHSMFSTKKVITTCVQQSAEFSLSVSRNKRISAAIESIYETTYTPVHYPSAVQDPDTNQLISDTEIT